MRMIALLGLLFLASCGVTVAATPKPTPTPSPTPDVGAIYSVVIGALHDSTATDLPAFFKTTPGSAEEPAAATKLAKDYESLLASLDAIPFPPSAKDDLSAFKKTVVARQVFWTDVSVAGSNYSTSADNSTNDAYNQAGILLGHDVGVNLVLQKPSPTPSA